MPAKFYIHFLHSTWLIGFIYLQFIHLPLSILYRSWIKMPSTQPLDTLFILFMSSRTASNEEPQDIGIVLEDIKALQDVDNVPLAVAMLFRLM